MADLSKNSGFIDFVKRGVVSLGTAVALGGIFAGSGVGILWASGSQGVVDWQTALCSELPVRETGSQESPVHEAGSLGAGGSSGGAKKLSNGGAARDGVGCDNGWIGCWRSRFIAAVVIGGDGFGVGSLSMLEGASAVISNRWIDDGPNIFGKNEQIAREENETLCVLIFVSACGGFVY
jgi:hypothetical protein